MIVRSVLDEFDPGNFDYFNDYKNTRCWLANTQRDSERGLEVLAALEKGYRVWLGYLPPPTPVENVVSVADRVLRIVGPPGKGQAYATKRWLDELRIPWTEERVDSTTRLVCADFTVEIEKRQTTP